MEIKARNVRWQRAKHCQSRPVLHTQNKQWDRLIRLAEAHPDWTLGFADEVWWSRVAQPTLHRWTNADHDLIEKTVAKTDPKALAGYGWLLPHPDSALSRLLLRFAAG
ncbi:hypothetical protein [Roseiflexus sp.]|uniref:hypothetical protein n=1 Tax=Roseiflexus sp. TaxID=2562120 RepID=UPI00398B6AC3